MSTRIFVHVGPPKSGTSAIQKWLSENQSRLEKAGVYYPSHGLDINGVSSGNLMSLFDNNKQQALEFSCLKADALLAEASAKNCRTILLSSEFFMRRLMALAAAFPNAVFIAYLRFPLEIIESNYNQSVKRHGQAKPLQVPKVPRATILNLFDRYTNELGRERFLFRPYALDCLEQGDIVADLLSQLGLKSLYDKPVEVVNTSYSFEALEVKRWLNQFELGDMQHPIDRYLQSFDAGCKEYSLMPPVKYNQLKASYLKHFERFCQDKLENPADFLDILRNRKQKTFRKQDLDVAVFADLVAKMLKETPEIIDGMRTLLERADQTRVDKVEYLEALKTCLYKSTFSQRLNSSASKIGCVIRKHLLGG